jgi:chromosome segregation ATPase
LETKLDRILGLLENLNIGDTQIMADLAALATEVNENADVIASAVQVLSSLRDDLQAAMSDPAEIQRIVDQLDSNTTALAAAIAAPSEGEVPETPADEIPGEAPDGTDVAPAE